LFYIFVFAQQNSFNLEGAKIDFNSSVTNLPLQVSFYESMHLSENDFTNWMKKEMVQSNDATFETIKTTYDKLGFTHHKLQQYYKGYKIDGAEIVSHSKNHQMVSFNGDWFKNITPNNSISISETEALQFALLKVNAKNTNGKIKLNNCICRKF